MSEEREVRLDALSAGELLTPTHHTPAAVDWEITTHPRELCSVEYCGRIAP